MSMSGGPAVLESRHIMRSSEQIPARPTVASVLRRYTSTNHQQLRLAAHTSVYTARVMRQIPHCRTGMLGCHYYDCDACGHHDIRLNSCGNRHCGTCTRRRRTEWRDRVIGWSLECDYLHLVFTLPHEQNDLMWANQRTMFTLLINSSIDTLKQVTERDYGCRVGMVLTLHTWGQRLNRHPHVHIVMTAGGLSLDGSRWIPISASDEAMNTRRLADAFKKTYLKRVTTRLKQGKLLRPRELKTDVDKPLVEALSPMLETIRAKSWMVDCQASPPQYQGCKAIVNYVAAYVSGTAIGNGRMISDDGQWVTFHIKDYAAGKVGAFRLAGVEFVLRFSDHILPRRMARVRYVGLFAPEAREARLALCRQRIEEYEITAGKPRRLPTPEETLAPEPEPTTGGAQICSECQESMVVAHRLEGNLTLRLVAYATTVVAAIGAGSRMPFDLLLRLAVLARHEEDPRSFPKLIPAWQESIVHALVEQRLRMMEKRRERTAQASGVASHGIPPPDT